MTQTSTRIQAASPNTADSELQQIYQNLEKKLGRIPNIFLNMGNSPAVLKGFLSLSEATNQTSLDPKLREQIALTVGQTNNCHYCLSAHTAIAKGTGLKDPEIMQARYAQAHDPKTQAILNFAKTVVNQRGKVSQQDVQNLKAAGVNDRELVEIILVIMVNMFTNYFNHITDPNIDFPIAPELS